MITISIADLINAFAQSMGIEAAEDFIKAKVRLAGLEVKDHYTLQELLRLTSIIIRLGGLVGVVAQTFTNQILLQQQGEAEQRARDRARESAEIFDSVNAGILIIHAANGQITAINEKARQVLGYTQDEIHGRDYRELFEAARGTTLPQLKRCRTMDNLELLLRTRDKGTITVLMSVKAILYSNHPSTLASFVDITERKRAEEELRQAKSYVANIINSMPSMLVSVDLDGVVTQWNNKAERVTGIASEQALGRSLESLVPKVPVDLSRVRDAIRSGRELLETKKPREHNGETRYEDVTIYPLAANGVQGAVIRVDDVTDKVRVEEMMVQSEKMLSVGGLAAGMAHEVNNPLAGMVQTAAVMSARLTDLDMPANQRAAAEAGITMEAVSSFMQARGILGMLERIQSAGGRAAEIVSNMLSFARKSDGSCTSHNLAKLLDQAVDLASSDYDLKKHDFRQIEIVRDYEEELPLIFCEKGMIQQVFLNILKNGAEAMQGMAGGQARKPRFYLRVRHEKQACRVVIEIEDNGPGMDEKIRKRVFEPFFTTKPVGVGTGLGLSVSYFIVTESYQGELSVESRLGSGSKFVISLPLETSGREAGRATGSRPPS